MARLAHLTVLATILAGAVQANNLPPVGISSWLLLCCVTVAYGCVLPGVADSLSVVALATMSVEIQTCSSSAESSQATYASIFAELDYAAVSAPAHTSTAALS